MRGGKTTTMVSADKLGEALSEILERFDKQTIKDANEVTKEYAKNMFGTIIEKTPVGDFDPDHAGTLKGGWVLRTGNVPRTLGKRDPTRTRDSLKIPEYIVTKKGTKRLYLANNHPYAGVVEYGGYPSSPKRGTLDKRTGTYQIRSSGGFSKQAPAGMVRTTLAKRKRFLEVAANKVL